MAVREVKPFDKKQWAQLMEDMKNGPTKEQIEKMKEARIRYKKIPHANF